MMRIFKALFIAWVGKKLLTRGRRHDHDSDKVRRNA
jgi:hypothetical protein